ncbi:uncharacterized WD repeat-containing protein C2A9.03-like isoform X3 [Panicum hallii]|uniref:uncharacterized WD repeat-containing protein C2A9.03-like isoform X3 n=1 Tax=Panicum hallii TaxID=206008 RepID=UPI000DF4E5D2|nr:uncharacterized WD repeat-containing protein C2A9.03-like isoform X3 [Panicum hallii]
MPDYHGGDVEEMEDEYDMNEPVDDMEEEEEEEEDEYQEPAVRDSDVEEEEDEDQSHKVHDTSAADVRNGRDIQGIPWEKMAITRETYRQARLEQYKNYENIPNSGEAAMKQACKSTEKGGTYYEFRRNTRSVKSTISHFQLRNLVWATSKHDVYLLLDYSVLHWSALSGGDTEIMDVDGHVAPSEKHPGSLLEGFFHTQISTMAVKDNLLVAGGFQGELICKHLDREGISFCCRTTFDDNAITNALEIFNTSSGALHFIASNNDCGVREYDMERYQQYKHFRFDWPVNHTSLSPDGKLVVIVGDDTDALLIDANSGKTIHSMKGHLDYSFASAWSPDGLTFATDGQFLSMAEAVDFVHIFDIKSDYNKRQELDFFGDVSGMSFSPDTDALYVGVSDRTYGSLLQFGRRYNYSYLDSLL